VLNLVSRTARFTPALLVPSFEGSLEGKQAPTLFRRSAGLSGACNSLDSQSLISHCREYTTCPLRGQLAVDSKAGRPAMAVYPTDHRDLEHAPLALPVALAFGSGLRRLFFAVVGRPSKRAQAERRILPLNCLFRRWRLLAATLKRTNWASVYSPHGEPLKKDLRGRSFSLSCLSRASRGGSKGAPKPKAASCL
jgi:hypothetical protein